MTDPRLVIMKWPQPLVRFLSQLEPTTFEQFSEMKMDDGHVARRRKFTPIPAFKGQWSMNASEYRMLDVFFVSSRGRHFTFDHPESGSTVYAVFRSMRLKKTHRFLSSTDPEWSTYVVEVFLVDDSDLIERTLKEGAVSIED